MVALVGGVVQMRYIVYRNRALLGGVWILCGFALTALVVDSLGEWVFSIRDHHGVWAACLAAIISIAELSFYVRGEVIDRGFDLIVLRIFRGQIRIDKSRLKSLSRVDAGWMVSDTSGGQACIKDSLEGADLLLGELRALIEANVSPDQSTI
jgi:hypothetical protein